MRSHQTFSGSVAARVTSFEALLSPAAWDALPLAARASDRLGDILLALDDINTDLMSAEAADLRWIEPTIRDVDAVVCRVLKTLAS